MSVLRRNISTLWRTWSICYLCISLLMRLCVAPYLPFLLFSLHAACQVGLPLKSNSNPRGAHREQELYELFANVAKCVWISMSYFCSDDWLYSYVLLNFEPVNDWHLRESALGAAEKVIGYVKGHLTKLTNGVVSSNNVGILWYLIDGTSALCWRLLWLRDSLGCGRQWSERCLWRSW